MCAAVVQHSLTGSNWPVYGLRGLYLDAPAISRSIELFLLNQVNAMQEPPH